VCALVWQSNLPSENKKELTETDLALRAQATVDRATIGRLREAFRGRVIRRWNFETEGECLACGATWIDGGEEYHIDIDGLSRCLAALPAEVKREP
jgi:hypothetical protein